MEPVPTLLARALSLHQLHDLARAEELYRAILRHDPGHVDARHLLGVLLCQRGDFDAGVAAVRQSVALRPDSAVFHHNLGRAYQERGRLTEALACYEHALRLQPAYTDAQANLGDVLRELDRPEDAIRLYQQALIVRPTDERLHNNLGNALLTLGRIDEAVASLRRAVALRPTDPELQSNLGTALREQANFDEARACFERALALRPDFAAGWWNRATLRLLLAEAGGWVDFEWRRRCPGLIMPRWHGPDWDGSPFPGKTLVLQTEQGLGDTFHFIRYAAAAKARGGRIVLEAIPALHGILSRCPGVDAIVGPEGTASDFQMPLLSLPRLLGPVPAPQPYLTADPARTERWRLELARVPGRKVGIVWQGNPRHSRDRLRSVTLAAFAPLAAVPGMRLFALQRGHGAEQIAGVSFPLTDLSSHLDDGFEEAAAILVNLDVLITIDTALAHLAGALGVRTWVALPYVPDWRWLLDRDDTPWYPTLRLFRQPRPHDWNSVFARLAQALEAER